MNLIHATANKLLLRKGRRVYCCSSSKSSSNSNSNSSTDSCRSSDSSDNSNSICWQSSGSSSSSNSDKSIEGSVAYCSMQSTISIQLPERFEALSSLADTNLLTCLRSSSDLLFSPPTYTL